MNDAAVKEKSWKEFQESGMLWMANTILQVFGWSIAIDQDENGNIIVDDKKFPSGMKALADYVHS